MGHGEAETGDTKRLPCMPRFEAVVGALYLGGAWTVAGWVPTP